MEQDNLCEKCGYYDPEEDPVCNWFSCDGLECDECNFTPRGITNDES